RRQPEVRGPPLRRRGRRLFRPPSRQARHHRLGADPRLARRNRQSRSDPAPRRARSLLHRKLVAPARRLHPGDDTARVVENRQSLLMAIAAHGLHRPVAAPAPVHAPYATRPIDRLGLFALWLTTAVSGIVLFEPAPYEFVSLLAMLLFIQIGIR